jgi:predicted dinucleotide-binding enzyme
MKIAVIGGTGLIGSQVVTILNASGHEAVPQSPSSGLDLLSGHGLPEALAGPAGVTAGQTAAMRTAVKRRRAMRQPSSVRTNSSS